MPDPIVSGSKHKNLAEDARGEVRQARRRIIKLLKEVSELSDRGGKPVVWHRDHTTELGLIVGLLIEVEVKQTEQLDIINSEFRKRGDEGNILTGDFYKDGTNE